MKSIYVQLLFPLNLRESTHMNLLSIGFPSEPQRNLLVRKGFNWKQFAFNSFESTFNWFSFKSLKNAPTVFAHNRVPSKQLHYWGSRSLIRESPWKIVRALFFNNLWKLLGLTIEFLSPAKRCSIIFGNCFTIHAQDTNRYSTLYQ